MQPPRKRYRIQDAPVAAVGAAAPRMLAGFAHDLRQEGREADPDLMRLTRELYAMRDAIATTKRELADLQRPPAGMDAMHRATGELDAVSSATERATTTILGAVEEIEMSANLIRADRTEAGRSDAASIILDRVLVLYEACNFQDLTGQRIRRVVTTLKFVEEHVNRLIAAWETANPQGMGRPGRGGRMDGLLSGPCLPGEAGHVTQSDVDAFF